MLHGARWSWARLLEHPCDVSHEHLSLVYRLNKPSCKLGDCQSNCKSSPFCLNGLSRLDLSEFLAQSTKQDTTAADSDNSVVQSTAPNGLKNYGSTCYLNAFLQLYYRFDELRQAIFSLPADNDEIGIIYQLQLIFSQLKLNKSGVVDPGGLIQCLHLCQEEQQDAPEFHCLFMHLLESHFQQSGLQVVDELLRGEYVYETRCLNCGFTSKRPSTFLELPLRVSSNTLPGCIRDYMKEEALTGENQYECPMCQTMHDGVRRVSITRTPRLLCIQLLRWTDQGKKYKARVRIPDMLQLVDLSAAENEAMTSLISLEATVKCLSDSHPEPKERMYRLCGVLLHIGAQPTSGHYIAVVRESIDQKENQNSSETDYWKVCNDTEVYTIPSSQFSLANVTNQSKGWRTPTGKEASGAPVNVKRSDKNSAPACKKPRTEESGNASEEAEPCPSELPDMPSLQWHSSPSAYMLFYQLMDTDQPKPEIDIPENLRQLVEEMNFEQDQQVVAQQSLHMNKLACLHNLLTNLCIADPACTPAEVSLLPTQWIRKWFDEPDQPPPELDALTTSASSSSSEDKPISTNNSDDRILHNFKLCPHGRVPVDLDANEYRAVSTAGLIQSLEPFGIGTSDMGTDHVVQLHRFEPCRDCVCLKVALLQLDHNIRALAKELDVFTHSKEVNLNDIQNNTVPPVNGCAPTAEPAFFWIGRRSLRQWRSLCRSYVSKLYTDSDINSRSVPHTTFNADVLCPHGQLRLNSKRIRPIPAALWHKLTALLPGAQIPTFPAGSSGGIASTHCPDCESHEEKLATRAATERDLLPRLLLPNCQRLPTVSLDRLKQADERTSVSSNGQSNGLSSDSTPTSKDPGSGVNGAALEPDLSSTLLEDNPADDPRAIFLIPLNFVQQWRRFVKNPMPESHPGRLRSALSVNGILCEHGQLNMPWCDLLSEFLVCPVTASEYKILIGSYTDQSEDGWDSTALNESEEETSDAEVSIQLPPLCLIPDASGDWQLHPECYSSVCTECHSRLLAQRSQFKNAQIRVRLIKCPANTQAFTTDQPGSIDASLTEGDSLTPGCSESTEQNFQLASNITETDGKQSDSNKAVVRRSRRQRLSPNDLVVRGSSDQLLQDFKVQLMNLLGVTPADQHLLLNGVELCDSKKTLSQLGVSTEDLLYLWTDAQPWDFGEGAIHKLTGEKKADGWKKRNPTISTQSCKEPTELGFKGTRLMRN